MAQGWISLHRKMRECWVWKDKPYSKGQAWVDLLLRANHEDKKIIFNGNVLEIERGSFVTSEKKLSEEWGWSRHKVDSFLKLLEIEHMIELQKDNKKTSINIVNYSTYQTQEEEKEPQKNTKRTSKGHQKDTNNNDNNINNIYIRCQHLTMTKDEYDKLAMAYTEDKVKSKLEYAENYAKLKNYKSLYLTLNNWLKADCVDAGTEYKPKKPLTMKMVEL